MLIILSSSQSEAKAERVKDILIIAPPLRIRQLNKTKIILSSSMAEQPAVNR